jgi:hypothetical protein
MMGWFGGGMSPLGWVATGVFWVFLLWLIMWLIARLLPGSAKKSGPTGDSPVDHLKSSTPTPGAK